MEFVLLTNLKLLTIADSFLLNIAEHENYTANKYENAIFMRKFHAQSSWAWIKFIPRGL